MELLLPDDLSPPIDGKGLIAGAKVQNGKYLVTHFVAVPDGESHENIIGYCVQISNRLFGGLDLVGCYSSEGSESSNLVTACRIYHEDQKNQSFVSVVLNSGVTIQAKRYVGSNQTSKSDMKKVPSSKYPLTILKSGITLSFTVAIDDLDFLNCIDVIQKRVANQSSNLMLSVNDTFGAPEAAIFPKNSNPAKHARMPNSILPAQIFLMADSLEERLHSSKNVLNFACSVALFGVINYKSTFGEARDALSCDLKRTMACRVEIIEDQVEDCATEDKENIQNLFSSFELARRVNYEYGSIPISLYDGRSQRASDDLADFFQISESTRLFQYPEEEIIEDEDETVEIKSTKQGSNLNTQIVTVVILIIGILMAILLQGK